MVEIYRDKPRINKNKLSRLRKVVIWNIRFLTKVKTNNLVSEQNLEVLLDSELYKTVANKIRLETAIVN